MTTVKLVAKTRVKFGGKGDRTPLGFIRTEEATEKEPGEEFEIDSKDAEELIAAGAALSPADYAAEKKAVETTDEKIARMREEVAASETEAKARAGDPSAISSNAHLAAQDREEAAIAAAQKKGGKKSDTADEEKKKK